MSKKTELVENLFRLSRVMGRGPHRPGHRSHGSGRLVAILENNDGTTSRELAELLDIRPSSLSEMLSRMESEGLIEKRADDSDKRLTRVFLAEKGKQLLEEIKSEHEQEAERIAACFSDEEAEKFSAYCQKLCEHLEAQGAGEHRGFRCPPPPPEFGEEHEGDHYPHHGPHHRPHRGCPRPRKL